MKQRISFEDAKILSMAGLNAVYNKADELRTEANSYFKAGALRMIGASGFGGLLLYTPASIRFIVTLACIYQTARNTPSITRSV